MKKVQKNAAILSHGNKFQNECNRKNYIVSTSTVHHSMLFTEIAQSKKVIDDVFFHPTTNENSFWRRDVRCGK